MALSDGLGSLRGAPPKILRAPITARVTRADESGVWVAPLGGDQRTPVGPCRGPDDIPPGTICLVVWTEERPWVLTAELVTLASADSRDVALLEQAAADAHDFADAARDEAIAEARIAAGALADTARADAITAAGINAEALAGTARADAIAAAEATAETLAGTARDDAIAVATGTAEALAGTARDDAIAAAAASLEDVIDDAPPGLNTLGGLATMLTTIGGAVASDTGRRVVVAAGDVPDLPDLEVLVRRRGDVVTVYTREPAPASHDGALLLFELPEGFRPDAPQAAAVVVDGSGALVAGSVLTVRGDGGVLLGAVTGIRHHASLVFTTSDPYPVALPGSED